MPGIECHSGRDAVPHGRRVPAVFLSRDGREEGEKGKPEKGNASQALLRCCLHIVFPRDRVSRERDMLRRNGGFPPDSSAIRETRRFRGCP